MSIDMKKMNRLLTRIEDETYGYMSHLYDVVKVKKIMINNYYEQPDGYLLQDKNENKFDLSGAKSCKDFMRFLEKEGIRKFNQEDYDFVKGADDLMEMLPFQIKSKFQIIEYKKEVTPEYVFFLTEKAAREFIDQQEDHKSYEIRDFGPLSKSFPELADVMTMVRSVDLKKVKKLLPEVPQK